MELQIVISSDCSNSFEADLKLASLIFPWSFIPFPKNSITFISEASMKYMKNK